MSELAEDRRLLVDTVATVVEKECPPQAVIDADGGWLPDLWATMAGLGFTKVGAPPELGGDGGSFEDAVAVIRTAAKGAVPLPLAETCLAARILSDAGVEVPAGPLAVEPARGRDGTLERVRWAAEAGQLLVVDDRADVVRLVTLPPESLSAAPPTIAGEPRADVELARAPVECEVPIPDGWSELEAERTGALLRVVQMAAALERVCELTVEYVSQRKQFGRPLASFQVIQQQLAVLLALSTAAHAAAESAVASAPGPAREFAVAAAKASVGEGCGRAARIAHQLHGAMGMTSEYQLHLFTRRLWAWRDDFSSETVWAERLGRSVLALDPDEIWERVSG